MPTAVGQAIVVRVVDYGEADRVATLVVREVGRVAALARSARKSRKRFAGLTLFALGEATLREGRGDLWSLDEFDVARGYPHLGIEVARVALAAYGCEVVRELLPPQQAEPRAFDLLCELLARLDAGRAQGAEGTASLRVFELTLLDLLGFGPALDRCLACDAGDGGDGGWVLDARRGGVVCGRCSAGHGPGEQALDAEARELLVQARALPLGRAEELLAERRSRRAWDGAREALQALLRQHLGRPLRSLEFIDKLNAAGA